MNSKLTLRLILATVAAVMAVPAATAAEATGPDSSWWAIFRDPALDDLERASAAANQDLREAVARVDEARAEARAVAAGFYPTVTAPLSASRMRTSNTGPVISSRIVGPGFFPATPGVAVPNSFAGQSLASTYDDFQVPLALGYEVDLFGRVRHAYGQARALAQASAADRQAFRLSLSSQVAASYFALRALDSKIAVLRGALGLRGDAVHIQEDRVKGGAASDIDLLRARVEYANTEGDLPDALQERVELENSLAELCGRTPGDFHLAPRPLAQIPPPAVPATIPAQAVSQRPDLLEAERRVAAAGEGVKASRAQFFPRLRLQAGYGYESAQARQLLEEQSHTWSITGALTIPIFEGGKNAADLRAAKARNAEALAAYQEAAFRAFREVDDALSNLRQRSRQAQSRQDAVAAAQRVYDASERSYRAGAMSYFEVIDSQRALLNAELAEVGTLNARYAATIDLVRATGGGYGAPAEAALPRGR